MDLSTTYLGLSALEPAHHGRLAARRPPGPRPPARGRGGRRRSRCTRCSRSSWHAEQIGHLACPRRTRRGARRGRLVLPAPGRVRAGAGQVSRAAPPDQGGGARARHRVAERHDRRRVDRLREGHGAGGRRRNRTQRLRRGHRPARHRRGRRAARRRRGRPRPRRREDPCRRQALAVLSRRSPTSRAGSKTLA